MARNYSDERQERGNRDYYDQDRNDRNYRSQQEQEYGRNQSGYRSGQQDYGTDYGYNRQSGGYRGQDDRFDQEYQREYGSGSQIGERGYGSGGSYGQSGYGPSEQGSNVRSGYSHYGTSDQGRRVGSFNSEDYGGRDYVSDVRGGRNRYGGQGGYYGGYRGPGAGGDYAGGARYSDRDERGFLDKAGDEIASWFGDDAAARRREQDHRGRGPSDYTRSDDRIREDVNDRLTDDWRVDASDISVSVDDGEVTLSGHVDSRSAKRNAEDCAHDVSGVSHVQNNLRIKDRNHGDNDAPTTFRGESASSGKSTKSSKS